MSTLIGKTVKVQKAGREHKACCPFHNEKTPSFTINDEKGFYHCFGCGAHGDAIRWMTDQRGLPFMDAVKELAAAAGMDVPAPDPRAAKRAEQAKGLHDAMAAAQAFFEEQLVGIDGAEARAYLQKRGISDATRRAFGFGYAPDSRGRLKAALKDFGEPMLVEAGLLIAPDDQRETYDRFRGRLMLPIRDIRGRVIAFGGRILGAGEPKYLNSPDTPLFDKGRTLYNIDKASPPSRNSGRIIVVEGYMDVIALAQAGIGEAVAPMGTALTEHQIERLWKMVDVPILCLDGDTAGQKAADRAALRALPVLKPGQSLAFATLPAGMDPDDVIRSGGRDKFEVLLALARPLDEHIYMHARAGVDMARPEMRAGLLKRLDDLAACCANRLVAAEYRRALRERFFGRTRAKGRVETANASRVNVADAVATAVVYGLYLYPHVARAMMEDVAALHIEDASLAAAHQRLIEALILNVAPEPMDRPVRLLRYSFTRPNDPTAPADLSSAVALMLSAACPSDSPIAH